MLTALQAESAKQHAGWEEAWNPRHVILSFLSSSFPLSSPHSRHQTSHQPPCHPLFPIFLLFSVFSLSPPNKSSAAGNAARRGKRGTTAFVLRLLLRILATSHLHCAVWCQSQRHSSEIHYGGSSIHLHSVPTTEENENCDRQSSSDASYPPPC